jgi:hypothetical protein
VAVFGVFVVVDDGEILKIMMMMINTDYFQYLCCLRFDIYPTTELLVALSCYCCHLYSDAGPLPPIINVPVLSLSLSIN